MPEKKRLGRPPLGQAKRTSMSLYLVFGTDGKKKSTSAYLSIEGKSAYLFLRKTRKGGFSLTQFAEACLQEEAKKWGWKSEGAAISHLKKRRGGFILSNFINEALQEEATASGWKPEQTSA